MPKGRQPIYASDTDRKEAITAQVLERYKKKYAELLNYKGEEVVFVPGKHLIVSHQGYTLDLYYATYFAQFRYISEEAKTYWNDYFKALFPDRVGIINKNGEEYARGSLTDFMKTTIPIEDLKIIADDCELIWNSEFILEKYLYAEGEEAKKPIKDSAGGEPTRKQFKKLIQTEKQLDPEKTDEDIIREVLDEIQDQNLSWRELQNLIDQKSQNLKIEAARKRQAAEEFESKLNLFTAAIQSATNKGEIPVDMKKDIIDGFIALSKGDESDQLNAEIMYNRFVKTK